MQRSLRHWARRVIQPDIFTHRVFVLHGQHGLVYALELGGERNRIKLTALWSFTHCTFNFIVDVWPCDGARCLLQFTFKWLLLITYWNNLSEAAHTRRPDHQNTSSYSFIFISATHFRHYPQLPVRCRTGRCSDQPRAPPSLSALSLSWP